MILYWFLLLFTAVIAYGLGSMSTLLIASRYVFRANLNSLGKGNIWISNFRRIYGVWGWIRLLLVEIVKDALPIGLGALLLGFKGHADVGCAFAGFCVVLGRLYPLFYDFKGCHATISLVVLCLFASPSVGIAMAVVAAAVTFFTKYITAGTLAGVFVAVLASLLLVDNDLVLKLIVIAGALAFIKHLPSISRILNGREEKLSFEEDITYKLDQKF